MALDELKDGDKTFEFEGVNFVMEEMLDDQFGDFIVEHREGGYMVGPVNQSPSDCGSCSGSCS